MILNIDNMHAMLWTFFVYNVAKNGTNSRNEQWEKYIYATFNLFFGFVFQGDFMKKGFSTKLILPFIIS